MAAAQGQAGVWTSPLVNAVLPRSLTVPVNHKGRYVRIQKSNQQTMYLAEVQVLQVTDVNLAKGMAASQAATCAWGPANLAVDGNTDPNPSDGSVTCAGDALSLAGVPNSWWQVDLGSRRLIKDIQIWNADLASNFRNFDFYVFVSDTPFQSTDLTTTRNQAGMWQTYWGPALLAGATILPVGRPGRYVRIQMNHQDTFYLAEVEVMGYGTDDLDDCPAADQCHTIALRDPQTGLCPAPVPLANGTACDDGNACTQGDTCQAGACAPGVARTCPSDPCHAAGTCDPGTGYCTIGNVPLADGTACDDGNRCSVGDACQAGTCLLGPTTGCTAADTFYPPVTNLGSLQGSSQAQDINQAGEVVGADATGSGAPSIASGALAKGFRWTATGGQVYLPITQLNLYPRAINSAGAIVGTGVAADGTMSPVKYDPAVDTQFRPSERSARRWP